MPSRTRLRAFVWRLQSESGNATDIAYNDDPSIMVNMSVWESLEALRDYAYKSDHMKVFRDRAKWFVKMDKPHYCLWWIPDGHIPPLPRAASGWSITKRMAQPRIRFGSRRSSLGRRKSSAHSIRWIAKSSR